MAEATKNLVAEYNAAVDKAIAALDAVAKEQGQGARLTLRPAGRPDGTGRPTFTGSRTTVRVRPGAVPLRGADSAFFYKLTNSAGVVE